MDEEAVGLQLYSVNDSSLASYILVWLFNCRVVPTRAAISIAFVYIRMSHTCIR